MTSPQAQRHGMRILPRDEPPRLELDLTQPDPIPDDGIARAVELMRSGRLFRYGETGDDVNDVAALECEFASLLGRRYAVGVNSCGAALFLALHAAGIGPGDDVLVNAFTLAPVPGAIAHCGANPVLVEVTPGCVIDLDDLRRKAALGAKALLLSHMRGHLADLDAVASVCEEFGLVLIEDCAHALGARWNDRLAGTFGRAACFSSQTFKHVNSGEGGIVVTDDDDLAARAILHSGSYMLYEQHKARPPLEAFAPLRGSVANYSMRMTAFAAALLRPQLSMLPERIERWNSLYRQVEGFLGRIPEIDTIPRPAAEHYVGSSIQFRFTAIPPSRIEQIIAICDDFGVHIKWFGARQARGFTSRPDHWAYVRSDNALPRTSSLLDTLCDMRIPTALTSDDCRTIGEVVGYAVSRTAPDVSRIPPNAVS